MYGGNRGEGGVEEMDELTTFKLNARYLTEGFLVFGLFFLKKVYLHKKVSFYLLVCKLINFFPSKWINI